MKQFDLLVFDWDGTLMDSAGAIVMSIQSACRDLDLPIPSDAASRHIIGLGLNEALAELLPGLSPSSYGQLVERYRHYFLSQDNEIPLFDGVFEAMQELSEMGFLMAVATGKSRRGLDRAFDHTETRPFFHASRCADESFSKPHPGMLLEILVELGVSADRALMIGDTTHDLQMAINAKVPSLGAAYGAHPKQNLVDLEPLACLDNFTELHLWLKTNA
ncbi:HAD-IA family hydrolase [Sulfurirhabdus autotrophica]|uniref:Phosphoglycolate phosphatase n=1 Tax=Sulfurirhabdus autotrophica TaxID=1706046 RepID=A0A4R3YHJ0_9PROT|nr:HAD-IA family hydrolase [Sulfurirhabdus autotrophica]TCV90053.1 phosphoglycolate phosphatase [Sulfurirhabdus autotrophica]